MIVSHKHRFIFLKPHKTAGTSVELILASHCGEKDVITPFIFDPDPDIRKKYGAPEPMNYNCPIPLLDWRPALIKQWIRERKKPVIKFSEHLNAAQIKQMVGDETWNNYRKISMVRNPWDQAVSNYNWTVYRKYTKGTFEEYIYNKHRSIWPFLSIDGEYDMDYVIRFENLNEDLRECLTMLGLSTEFIMPQAKTGIRKDNNFRGYYTDQSIRYVHEQNKKLIDRFGYTFYTEPAPTKDAV